MRPPLNSQYFGTYRWKLGIRRLHYFLLRKKSPRQLAGDCRGDDVRLLALPGERPKAPAQSHLRFKIQHAVDKALYALRNRIERFFNRAKNSRRVAKLIESFAAFVLLACIRIWIKFVHAA